MSFHKNNKTMVGRNLFIGGVMISLVLTLTNCESIRCIKGNDNLVTEDVRNVEDFNTIVLEANYDVSITQDTVTSISILADDNLIPYIITEVAGNELILTTANNRCLRSQNDIRVFVTTPNIKKIVLEGSGDMDVDPITLNDTVSTNELEVVLDGSGNIDLGRVFCDELFVDLYGSGEVYFSDVDVLNNIETLVTGSGDVIFQKGIADIGIFTIDGSGSILAENVRLKEADVLLTGSGDIFVWADEHLYGELSGSGDVVYRTFPTKGIHINITGSGIVAPL